MRGDVQLKPSFPVVSLTYQVVASADAPIANTMASTATNPEATSSLRIIVTPLLLVLAWICRGAVAVEPNTSTEARHLALNRIVVTPSSRVLLRNQSRPIVSRAFGRAFGHGMLLSADFP